MFGKRSDGKLVKGLDGFTRLTPLLMPKRCTSTNYFLIEQEALQFDNYINENKEKGKHYSYLDIIITALIRIFKMRPKLNRFIVNGRTYQRNHIDVSMVVKKVLKDSITETTVKMRFTGYETISEVKDIIDKEVNVALYGETDADGTSNVMGKMPHFLLKAVVGILRMFDRYGILSKKFIKTSPFHTSIFVTHLKSIKMDFVYHHLYEFGNVGFFIAVGKEKIIPHINSNTNQIEPTKILKLGISIDERYADGLYYSNALKKMKEYFRNPHLLEKPLEESEIQYELVPQKKKKKKNKEIKKAEVKQLK